MIERDKYMSIDTLWQIIDTLAVEIIKKQDDPLYTEGESSRMFLVGQRELLDKLIEFASDSEYSVDLKDLLESAQEEDAF